MTASGSARSRIADQDWHPPLAAASAVPPGGPGSPEPSLDRSRTRRLSERKQARCGPSLVRARLEHARGEPPPTAGEARRGLNNRVSLNALRPTRALLFSVLDLAKARSASARVLDTVADSGISFTMDPRTSRRNLAETTKPPMNERFRKSGRQAFELRPPGPSPAGYGNRTRCLATFPNATESKIETSSNGLASS